MAYIDVTIDWDIFIEGTYNYLDIPFEMEIDIEAWVGDSIIDTHRKTFMFGEDNSNKSYYHRLEYEKSTGSHADRVIVSISPVVYESNYEITTKVEDKEKDIYSEEAEEEFYWEIEVNKTEKDEYDSGEEFERAPFERTPDRKFGNDDVILRWHDGKMLNLQYVENVEVSMENQITEHPVPKRVIDEEKNKENKTFSDNQIKKASLELEVGDVWGKKNGNGLVKYYNRNSTLKILNYLYENNIILRFESDIDIFNYAIISELGVEQTSSSNNTYIVDCTIKQVNMIYRLPMFSIVEKDGELTTEPIEDGDVYVPTVKKDEEESEEDDGIDWWWWVPDIGSTDPTEGEPPNVWSP
ncbi:MAG: phage baseplate protein [Promethearchaeota archaeon]